MDGRSATRSYGIQVGLVSALVIGLYVFLAWRDTPELTLLEFIKGVVKFFLGLWGRINPRIWLVFFDISLLLLLSLLCLAFFAQFSLPVRNFVQRWLGFLYITRFYFPLFRWNTPPIRIDNGEIPKNYPRNRVVLRPGVIIFDTASAGLLRRPTGFTRSVGPGLVFTRRFEYLAAAVDLHPMIWPSPPFGPRGEEEPFKAWDPKTEAREAFDERQKRRYETSAQTRDGVEVVANIFVACQLDKDLKAPSSSRPPRQSWILPYMESETATHYGYSPEAVRLAVTGQEVDPKQKPEEIDRKSLPWYELAAYLAVDLWREYLRKFTFEELFTELEAYPDPNPDPDQLVPQNLTAYQVIQNRINHRLTKAVVDEIGVTGQPTQQQVESREFRILQDRGIKVRFAVIRNVQFDPQVDQQLEDKWFAYWRWRAEDEREYVDRLRSYRMHEGELQAQRNFAYEAARPFAGDVLRSARPGDANGRRAQLRASLELMLRGTLDQCVSDTMLHQRLVGEEAQLVAIIDWLRRQEN